MNNLHKDTSIAPQTELHRPIKAQQLPGDAVTVTATLEECTALAARFGLASVANLRASMELKPDGQAVLASGILHGDVMQYCSVSAEAFSVTVKEELRLRFVEEGALTPQQQAEGGEAIEVELTDEDCDEIEYGGDAFDLGEAIAQSLGLAIDPYATGPDADATRAKAGIGDDDAPSGPLAQALAGLKLD